MIMDLFLIRVKICFCLDYVMAEYNDVQGVEKRLDIVSRKAVTHKVILYNFVLTTSETLQNDLLSG